MLSIYDFIKLSSEEKKTLTEGISVFSRLTDSKLGYIFTNSKTKESVWSPLSVDGVSGRDLCDYNVYRLTFLNENSK